MATENTYISQQISLIDVASLTLLILVNVKLSFILFCKKGVNLEKPCAYLIFISHRLCTVPKSKFSFYCQVTLSCIPASFEDR